MNTDWKDYETNWMVNYIASFSDRLYNSEVDKESFKRMFASWVDMIIAHAELDYVTRKKK